MKKLIFIVIAFAMVLASCSAPRQVAYFQDVSGRDTLIANVGLQPLKVQPGEKLMIVVHSSVPELAATFNLPVVGYRLGASNTNQNYTSTYATMSYTVSPEGYVPDSSFSFSAPVIRMALPVRFRWFPKAFSVH